MKFLPLFGSVAATSVVFVLQQPLAYASALPSFSGRTVFRFLSHKWYFDLVYNRFVNQPLLIHAYNLTFSLIDKGLLEEFGPRGAGVLLNRAGRILASAQTGRVFDYAFSLLAALFFFLVWVV